MGGDHSLDLMDTLRNLRAGVRRFKEDNERLVRTKERQFEIDVVIMQSLSNLQRQTKLEMRASHRDRRVLLESEEKTIGVDGLKSRKRHRWEGEYTMRGNQGQKVTEWRMGIEFRYLALSCI